MSANAEIATLYSTKYHTGIELLSQQLMSRMLGAVMVTYEAGAERIYKNQVGTRRMQQRTERAAEVTPSATPHARRALDPLDFTDPDYIDSFDKLKVLEDPTSSYVQASAAAAARQIDKIVLDAATGTALTGKAGGTSTTLASYASGSHEIAAGGTGFTLNKLMDGVQRLKTANALMPGDMINCAWTAKQEREFINTTEVKSSDFTTKRILDVGGVDEFFRVQFHLIEDLSDDAAGRMLAKSGTTRSCVMWVKSGVWLNIWKRPTGQVEWVPTRKSWLVSTDLSAGATRMEEAKVVKIDVVES